MLLRETLTPRIEHDVEEGTDRFIATIDGKPVPLRRSIFVKRVNRAINPSNKQLKKVKDELRQHLRDCSAGLPFVADIRKSVKVDITFRCRRPQAHFTNGDRKKSVREDKQHERHTCGDIDNLIKFVLDAGNDVLFTDDRQICELSATIVWHGDPTSEGSTTIAVQETQAG